MRLFYKDKQPDFNKIHEYTSKGYGIPHPERVNGYAGAFLFTLLDVYISDDIERCIEANPEFSQSLLSLLDRFKANDYGDITKTEQLENTEQRYIGGGHLWMIARYLIDDKRVVFESFYDMSLIYQADEDIDAIWAEQDRKAQYAKNHRTL